MILFFISIGFALAWFIMLCYANSVNQAEASGPQ